MLRLLLPLWLVLASPSLLWAKPPPCRGSKQVGRVEQALGQALASSDDDLGEAYSAFVDGLGSLEAGVALGRIPAAFAVRPRDFYLRPRENGWVRIIYSGASYRLHDKSPSDAETCVDEFLVIIAAPLYGKWGSERRYFFATAQIDNRKAGPSPVMLRHLGS